MQATPERNSEECRKELLKAKENLSGSCSNVVGNLVELQIYSPVTKKRSKRYNEFAQELPAICLPHQDGGIPLR